VWGAGRCWSGCRQRRPSLRRSTLRPTLRSGPVPPPSAACECMSEPANEPKWLAVCAQRSVWDMRAPGAGAVDGVRVHNARRCQVFKHGAWGGKSKKRPCRRWRRRRQNCCPRSPWASSSAIWWVGRRHESTPRPPPRSQAHPGALTALLAHCRARSCARAVLPRLLVAPCRSLTVPPVLLPCPACAAVRLARRPRCLHVRRMAAPPVNERAGRPASAVSLVGQPKCGCRCLRLWWWWW